MTKGIIVSPANRGVQVVVTDENNVQLLVDSNRGVNLEIVPQPRIEVLVDKGVEGAQGPQGPQGTAATVTAGTTTTGVAGTNANVTNSGTSSAAVFDFTIPRGDTGATGAGVATGGTTGQFLQKASNANYDTTWATITGTLVYQGSWNASTNTPTLTSSVGTNGYYYVVGTSGSTNLNGITDWVVGDWAIFNGSVWQKIDNTDLVSSVNGQTGVVVLDAADVGALSEITSTDGSVTITSPNATTRDLSVAVSGATTNVLCLVRNTTGETLTKGTVVYISGATGQNPTVSKAIATSDATSAQTLGMMTADLANNSNGYVTVIGLITNIDTSAYTDGAQLYLSGTVAGAVTATKPAAPIHLVYVAVVEHAHPTQGKLFVKVQNGYELDEIHDVSIVSPTTGQTLVYNASTDLWENSNAPVISGTTINNTTIGATTPSTGVFTTLTGGGGSANFFQTQGAATTKAVEVKALGSDTNIAFVIDSKGTAAIDLAAGSSGVNISNGGTVTALTVTASGASYTSIPSVAITAPTTASGVQATASALMFTSAATVANGGTGYAVNDVISIVGGTYTTQGTYTVSAVSGGVITAVTRTSGSGYSVLPTNPVSTTGGTGTGATLNITAWTVSAFTITNAGSGYVEQPTVTFSGGGGSGAAAFATIGSATSFKSLSDLTVNLPSGPVLSMTDSSLPSGSGAYLNLSNGSSSNAIQRAAGTATNIGIYWLAKGTGIHSFATNNSTASEQFRVAHTSSPVNYVQVTGAATGASPTISAQGSDTNIPLTLNSKGNNGIVFQTRGGGTPRIALQLLDSGSASVNYLQIQSNISGAGPVLSALGSDTNISQVFQSKGTGAIDLAAGSSGVNISNGGTVTAITGTAFGSNYTSAPSVVISAPTTAGGVQATATIPIQVGTVTISSGGTGYTVNDVLTVVGGTFTTVCQLTVSAVSGGVITAVTTGGTARGNYTVAPSNPASVTGGTGSGATFTLNFAVANNTTFTITNAGSGYVEQPTVTFSGGGGSGAAAYATVGAGTVIRSLGLTGTQSLSFFTPSGEAVRIRDTGSVGAYSMFTNTASGTTLVTQGTANAFASFNSNGTGAVLFGTNGNSGNTQMVVSHTASAVNYVQVTGAATTNLPVISAQGSDTNIAMYVTSKGNGTIRFATNNSAQTQLRVSHTTSAVNFLNVTGSIAGAAPVVSVDGNDTNIDLALTPKGTGNVRFGTYSSLASTTFSIDGYIEIKDSAGNIRKLAVIV